MKPMSVAFTAVLFVIFSVGALAADDGELWEITNQMNVPGMPAGMGGMTSRVCQAKGTTQVMPEQENCRIADQKRSGNKTTMTVVCPDSRAVIEQTYNAAGTEFKGTMRMTGKQGDMTMAMSGRKVGTCDATAERKKQDAQMASIQQQHDQTQALMRRERETQIAQCNEAVQNMDYGKLGPYGMCRQAGGFAEYCKAMSDNPDTKPVATACMARQTEFCKRYRTEDGFIRAKADPKAAEACGTSPDEVKAALCPGAAQKESLLFLGRYCPVEAKPLAQKHCAGRDFTALRAAGGKGDKYDAFCYAYLSNASLAARDARDAPAQSDSLPDPAKAVTDGVTQGINRLRGLFGR